MNDWNLLWHQILDHLTDTNAEIQQFRGIIPINLIYSIGVLPEEKTEGVRRSMPSEEKIFYDILSNLYKIFLEFFCAF